MTMVKIFEKLFRRVRLELRKRKRKVFLLRNDCVVTSLRHSGLEVEHLLQNELQDFNPFTVNSLIRIGSFKII